jgi:hypothetical protein
MGLLTGNRKREEAKQLDSSNNYYFSRPVVIRKIDIDKSTVIVEELGKGFTRSQHPVKLTFPYFGDGYGIYYLPIEGIESKGDNKTDLGQAILTFYGEGFGVITNSVPWNYVAQTSLDVGKRLGFLPLRKLKLGEICIRSKSGSEIFFDNAGKLHILSYKASDSNKPTILDTVSNEVIIDKDNLTYTGPDNTSTVSIDKEGKINISNQKASVSIDKDGNFIGIMQKDITIEAQGASLKLKMGNSTVELDSSQVKINGTNLTVDA